MGMVLLAVTGCEALYADIGHFGAQPLRRAWWSSRLPGPGLQLPGPGRLGDLRSRRDGAPFLQARARSAPRPHDCPRDRRDHHCLSGNDHRSYSLTQQAVQLGYLPRLRIIHTNPDIRGQIYMPQVNFLLMVACIALVISFESSSNLAAAYGLSVAMGMLLTSILLFLVARRVWGWSFWRITPIVLLFVVLEFGYVAGSLSKFMQGAWFPLVVAAGIWIIMKTWTDGRAILFQALQRGRLPVQHLIDEIKNDRITRVAGTAVFMSATADGLPLALLHHLKHNKALHHQVVLLTVRFEDEPYVPAEERVEVSEYYTEFYRVILRYGFSESPTSSTTSSKPSKNAPR